MAVHELDLPVAREALPSAAGGQPGRDVVVAALVRQRSTERRERVVHSDVPAWRNGLRGRLKIVWRQPLLLGSNPSAGTTRKPAKSSPGTQGVGT